MKNKVSIIFTLLQENIDEKYASLVKTDRTFALRIYLNGTYFYNILYFRQKS